MRNRLNAKSIECENRVLSSNENIKKLPSHFKNAISVHCEVSKLIEKGFSKGLKQSIIQKIIFHNLLIKIIAWNINIISIAFVPSPVFDYSIRKF